MDYENSELIDSFIKINNRNVELVNCICSEYFYVPNIIKINKIDYKDENIPKVLKEYLL